MKDERFKHLDFVGRCLLIKEYFDKGMSLLNYITKLMMVIGIGAVFQNFALKYVALIGVAYAVFAIILGKLWFYYKLMDRENEINNIVNPFQVEVRDWIKTSGGYSVNRKV